MNMASLQRQHDLLDPTSIIEANRTIGWMYARLGFTFTQASIDRARRLACGQTPFEIVQDLEQSLHNFHW